MAFIENNSALQEIKAYKWLMHAMCTLGTCNFALLRHSSQAMQLYG